MEHTEEPVGSVRLSTPTHEPIADVMLPAHGIVDVAPGVRGALVLRRDRRYDLLLLLAPALRVVSGPRAQVAAACLPHGEQAAVHGAGGEPLLLDFATVAGSTHNVDRCDICRDGVEPPQRVRVCSVCASAACVRCGEAEQCLECGALWFTHARKVQS